MQRYSYVNVKNGQSKINFPLIQLSGQNNPIIFYFRHFVEILEKYLMNCSGASGV